jgi:hypothetical protein
MEAALRWLADHTPATTELLRLLDGTPVVCGRSRTTATRSDLFGWAGSGRDPSHHCFYWGARLLLVGTPEGTVTGFGLANPKLVGEREAVVGMLGQVPANRPAPGTLLVGDKGFAGGDFQADLAGLELGIVRPARADEPDPGSSRTGCGSGSRRSSGPSSTSSAWTTRVAAFPLDCGRGWCSACSRSTPRSGSTGRSAPRSSVP